VWLLISKVLNAAIVTSVIAQTSSCVSFLITISGFMLLCSSSSLANVEISRAGYASDKVG